MKILECGCHAVNEKGNVFSRIEQFSKKGLEGIQTKKSNQWHVLKTTKTRYGYFQATIHKRSIRVNRLIAFNFIKNPMGFPEAQHKNGIRTDNRVCNLKWGNQQHNADDRENHGNTMRGIKNPNAKLCNESVREIRAFRMYGITLQSIANKFGVSKKLILLVVQNKIWKHVK